MRRQWPLCVVMCDYMLDIVWGDLWGTHITLNDDYQYRIDGSVCSDGWRMVQHHQPCTPIMCRLHINHKQAHQNEHFLSTVEKCTLKPVWCWQISLQDGAGHQTITSALAAQTSLKFGAWMLSVLGSAWQWAAKWPFGQAVCLSCYQSIVAHRRHLKLQTRTPLLLP